MGDMDDGHTPTPPEQETGELKPCPFCGETPDINDPHVFQDSQGTKWGAVVCCCTGPEVRTDYQDVDHWRVRAIEAWNRRARLSSEREPDGEWTEGWVEAHQRPGDSAHFIPSEEYASTYWVAKRPATLIIHPPEKGDPAQGGEDG